MTAEQVFKYYRIYKLYYQGKFDIKKYGGHIRTPPLIQQPDRRFYWRIAQKLDDAQIHALFTTGFFYNPSAYVADLATQQAFSAAIQFASRAENGRPLLEADLYTLQKRLRAVDLDAWLYGEIIDNGRASVPPSVQAFISGELPLDIAALVLLIPQPSLNYRWTAYFDNQPSFATGLGAKDWVERLRKADKLLYLQRPTWRMESHALAKEFWAGLNVTSLAPKHVDVAPALF